MNRIPTYDQLTTMMLNPSNLQSDSLMNKDFDLLFLAFNVFAAILLAMCIFALVFFGERSNYLDEKETSPEGWCLVHGKNNGKVIAGSENKTLEEVLSISNKEAAKADQEEKEAEENKQPSSSSSQNQNQTKKPRSIKAKDLMCVARSKDRKTLSWVLSCFNSGITSCIGIAYLCLKADASSNPLNVLTYALNGGKEVFHCRDNLAILTCLWFAMFNVTDILFGLVFYSEKLDIQTAYIHHPVYIWIMIASTTGQGGFATFEFFSSAFVLMCLEELPTFVLALGSVFPSMRNDLGFGGSFFLTRILYHGFMIFCALKNKANTVVLVLYSLTLLLHIHWFYSWFVGMIKRSSKGKSGGDKKEK